MTREASPPDSAAEFFVTGGTRRRNAASYVRRPADNDLLRYLLAGEYCNVLTARQMGKSSLMVQTAERLKAEGVRSVIIDLTAIGQEQAPGDKGHQRQHTVDRGGIAVELTPGAGGAAGGGGHGDHAAATVSRSPVARSMI